MPNDKNKQIVENLKEKLEKATSVTFTDYIGIKTQDLNNLRQKVRDDEGEVVIAKNTLMKVAIEENKNTETKKAEKDLEGPTMAIFSYGDPIKAIKTLLNFAKETELPKIKSAILEGTYNTADKIEAIREIPSKEELIAKLLGSLNSPISGLVSTFGGVQRKFVYAIKAIADKKE